MIKADVQELLQPLVTDLGFKLWGCEYLSQGKHSLLRIYIDKDNGITITDCEQVSRQISAILDVEDLIPGNYNLEVSSPGIPRPLFYKDHYYRYINHDVQLKLYKPLNGNRKIRGTISAVNDSSIVLQLNDERQELPFSQIVKANLIGE
jgi:ribosome maturation factor RimP